MNWSNVNKSIFVLILGAIDISLWIIWWFTSYQIPELRQWINLQHYPVLLTVYSLSVIGYIILIIIIHQLRQNQFVEKYVAYFSVFYLGVTFIYGAYCVGIVGPASIAGYVSLVTVGLVLFKSREVYATTIPITLFIIISGYLSVTDQIAYAPIYAEKLQELPLQTNTFWINSTLFFYIPIFFVSIVLFIILLIQWKYREDHISRMSQIDPLTQVYNRRSIGQFLKKNHEHKKKYILVLLDLDFFKKINDTYGHAIGDQVLQKVAHILSENIRKEDYVGRFGGEEFILILNNIDLNQAVEIAERCRLEIERNCICLDNDEKLFITASFGISTQAVFVNELVNNEEFISQADKALYFAKSNGRNQVIKFIELKYLHI